MRAVQTIGTSGLLSCSTPAPSGAQRPLGRPCTGEETARALALRDRLSVSPDAFRLLTDLAVRRHRIAYADFAFELSLGSPRRLGWLLTPLVQWCAAEGLPMLPIIVVRRADGLPSGGYDPATVAAETERVFGHSWSEVAPPTAAVLFEATAIPKPFSAPASRTIESC